MPEFVLFAAKDGEAFVSNKAFLNRKEASHWALTKVTGAFGLLKDEVSDLSDLQGQIDGFYLEDLIDLLANNRLTGCPPMTSGEQAIPFSG